MSNPCSSSAADSNIWEKDEYMPTHESVGVGGGRIEKEVMVVPMGYHFCPTDLELFQSYLINKILGRELSCDVIREIDVFKHDPEQLPQCEFKHGSKKIAYFFTFDEGKDLSGEKTIRETSSGYWEINGEEVFVLGPGITGFKSDSVFYDCKADEGKETSWRMTQYRVKFGPVHAEAPQAIKYREKYSVCKIWSHYEEEEELWEMAEDSWSSDSEIEED